MQRDDDAKPAAPRPGPSLARPADAGREAASTPESPPAKRRFAPISAPSVAMPKGGGALRGLGETFQVNAATGTASFSLPLPISAPGRVLPPALSLGYDGGSGQGPFGAGFSLSAPHITRKTDKKIPEYLDSEDSDRFVLSGAEDLVPMLDAQGERVVVTTATERRERFRPRVEGAFSRIERVTTLASGEVHWSATSRDDTTSLFGASAASRIADPAQPKRVFSWLLSRTTDDRGNVVEYDYVAEDLAGLPLGKPREAHRKAGLAPVTANRYLKRVRYGNTVVGDAASCKLELVFDYGDHPEAIPTPTPSATWPCRQDPFSTYRAGFEIRSYRLCRRVLMFHRFGELPLVPLLVRALELTYEESPRMTRLTSVTERGYAHDGASYSSAPLPTLTLSYTSDALTLHVRDLGPAELGSDYPARQMGSSATWVDLDGEGLPGVLIDDGAGHRYKPSRGGRKLHAARVLPARPAIASGGTQLVDVAGTGTLSMVMTSGGQPGFQERTGDGWAPFLPFKAFPNVDLDGPNVRFMDLDGDGIADLILARGTHLEWYPSRGRAGYGPARRIPISGDLKKDPSVVFADQRNAVLIADMSGDGLPDLVRVTWSGVMYWPNLGHGKFGPAVTMDSAPVLDDLTQFDARRVRLADLDGTGTADLLYHHATKGLCVYRNQAGNGFSEATTLLVPPEAARGALIDLQGNGTTSLVYDVQGPGPLARAIDFVAAKPHLLAQLDNGCGQLVRLEHGTSTQHYLRDRLAGQPWATRLPFPVHVVDKVESYDEIAKLRLITEYAYHHGHYDTVEREFRGFGRVDQTDAERVGATHGKGLFPDYPDPINGETPLPPVLTKTWFSTGAWRERDAQTAAYAAERWSGDTAAPTMPGPLLPSDLPPEELREAHRAHRGQLLRQEVYALDGSPDEPKPYLVTERAVEIRRLQPRQPARAERPALPGVFHLVERETRTWAYDRDPSDPRLSQTLALDVDPYGTVTRSAALAYPRRFTSTHPEQNALHCVVEELDVLHLDATPDGHRLAIPLEARTYHLTGQSPPLLGAPLERASVRQDHLAASEIAPHETPTTGLQKRLLSREKARYYQSSALPNLHPFGQADPRALLYQTYQLDLTDALITQVYGTKITPALISEAHYLTPAGETGHWIPSDVATFEPSWFYLPSSLTDPFGGVTSVQYDAHKLFPATITDDLGNTSAAQHDYRTLQPSQITDPNGNRTQASYHPLGLLSAIAVMGKTGGSDGDTLADPTIKLTYDLTPASGKPRSVKTEAREVHGPSNTRWHTTIDYTAGSGALAMTKVRCEPGDAPQRDASGDLILPIQQAHSDPRWIGTGRTVLNNKGAPLKQYEPYFSSTSDYETEPELTDTGITPVITYDPLGRVIRTDLPNGSYSRVALTPWVTTTHDVHDTLLEPGNLWRAARQPTASPTPSAEEQRARQLAEAHAETPSDLHKDSLGRPFLAVARLTTTTQLETRSKLDVQGRPLEIKDPLGRTCQTYAYSLTGRLLRETNLDKGTRWTLQAVDGAPIRRWDHRDQTFRTQLDALRRPTHHYLKVGAAQENLLQRTLYGESAPTPEVQNLRGKPIRHYDAAGALKSESYDFKGNPLETQRRLALAFTAATDWTPLASATTPSAIDAAAAALLEAETFTQTRQYDALNRITSQTEPDLTEIKPTYNQRGLLQAVEARVRGSASWTTFISAIAYDAKAQRQSIAYGNGTTTRYQYDELTYRLQLLTTTRTSPSNTLQHLSFVFDAAGNIVQITDAAQQTLFYNNSVVLPQNLFEYDALYRLTSATGREHASIGDVQVDHNDVPLQNLPHNNDANAVRTYLEEYAYDHVGNILEMFHEAAGTPVATWTRTYTYASGNNRLSSNTIPGGTATYTHDAHGSITSMPHLAAITYSPFDQMASADLGGGGDVYYTYGSDGQRVRKVWQQTASAVKERIYLGGYEIYREKSSGAVQVERQTLHIMDGVQRIAMVETKTIEGGVPITTPVPKQRYQLGNHLGSAMLEVDETGLIISYDEYAPYGTSAYRSARSGVEVNARRYRYTGKERDDETGLYYYGARYYSVWLGRWTSADPLGIGADGPGLYNYVRGSPVNLVDPNGTDARSDYLRAQDAFDANVRAAEESGNRAALDTAREKFQQAEAEFLKYEAGRQIIERYQTERGSSLRPREQEDTPSVRTAVSAQASATAAFSHAAPPSVPLMPVEVAASPPGLSRGQPEAPAPYGLQQFGRDLLEGFLAGFVGEAGAPTSQADIDRQPPSLSNIAFGLNVALAVVGTKLARRGGAVGRAEEQLRDGVPAEDLPLQRTNIAFGRNANQLHHAFRHVDELGLERAEVRAAIEQHLATVLEQIPAGRPLNQTIEVGGRRIQYSAFRLPDGTINVGRIHGVP